MEDRSAIMIEVSKIVSGGQTGVDRAALDVALALEIPCGGWCPLGRRAEDGRIADLYPLEETDTKNYAHRTRLNVQDSDGTLIVSRRKPTGGTALTIDLARKSKRPVLCVDPTDETADTAVAEWINDNNIQTLNVAGPRESSDPGLHSVTVEFLTSLFQ